MAILIIITVNKVKLLYLFDHNSKDIFFNVTVPLTGKKRLILGQFVTVKKNIKKVFGFNFIVFMQLLNVVF